MQYSQDVFPNTQVRNDLGRVFASDETITQQDQPPVVACHVVDESNACTRNSGQQNGVTRQRFPRQSQPQLALRRPPASCRYEPKPKQAAGECHGQSDFVPAARTPQSRTAPKARPACPSGQCQQSRL